MDQFDTVRQEQEDLLYRGWKYAGVIILLGLLILVTTLVLLFIGETSHLLILVKVLAPLSPFFLGVVGLSIFGRESLVKEDRFHALNVWIALGLVVFSLSEFAGVILHVVGSAEILFMIGLIQLPALMLWGLGVLGYLRASNSALGVAAEGFWIRVILITTIATLVIVVLEVLFIPNRSIIELGVSILMVIVLGIILIALGRLLWVLRSGLIARPLTLLFLGVMLFLIRNLFWNFFTYAPDLPFDYVTAIESYILIGGSLLASSSLEEVFNLVEEVEE